MRNRRMLRLLERIALKFQEADIALLVLKGAALNVTVYRHPDERPMADLDLMIHPEDADRACGLLEAMGGLRGEAQVRDDFFPHFHYELEYRIGAIYPVKIDLHVRPFRPLRYVNLVPPDALWSRAIPISFGRATLWIPSPEDMLIHLMVHAAVHAFADPKWLEDIRRWLVDPTRPIRWETVLHTVEKWGLKAPFRAAGLQLEREHGPVLPIEVRDCIARMRCSWRDHLTLWHAPRDASHPLGHVVVNAVCTPGFRFVLAYLLRMVFPSKAHMADWYPYRFGGWVPVSYFLRWLQPVVRWVPGGRRLLPKIELRPSRIHGLGVFATRQMACGEVIGRYHGKVVAERGPYVVHHPDASGGTTLYELTGPLRFLNHSCRPNTVLSGFKLIARRPVAAGQELTIAYGAAACDCAGEEFKPRQRGRSIASTLVDVRATCDHDEFQ